MPEYLKFVPKPLLDDLVTSRCIPFVGAGLSRNADLPAAAAIPDWDALGRALAGDMPDFEYSSALDAISAYAHEYGRARLVEELRRLLLIDEAQPGAAHKAFCKIPFELIFTTNFDFLLERGYGLVGRGCTPITGEDQLVTGPLGSSVRVVKLHGDLHHPDKLVIVEHDYDATLQRFPLMATFLANMLIHNTAFFIGYSLDDPDFRQIWHVIGERLGKLRRIAYTVAVNATSQSVARYERRGVKLINVPGKVHDYANILAQLFSEIDEHISSGIVSASTSLEEQSLQELSLPKGTTGRLCLFLLPNKLQSLYRQFVFPLAQDAGFTPMTVDEIISPGESIVAKIVALIDRSDLIVVDCSSPNTILELGLLKSREIPSNRVLIIAEDTSSIPIDTSNTRIVVRRSLDELPTDDFLTLVEQWFQTAAQQLPANPLEEARRLLAAGEYRAATIASAVALEDHLRKQFAAHSEDKSVRRFPTTVRDMLKTAESRGLLDADLTSRLQQVVQLRSRLIHSLANVSQAEASRSVESVAAALNRLRVVH
jgi:hypothetical protein